MRLLPLLPIAHGMIKCSILHPIVDKCHVLQGNLYPSAAGCIICAQ